MRNILHVCTVVVLACPSTSAAVLEAAVFPDLESAVIRFRSKDFVGSSQTSLMLHGQCALTRDGFSTLLWAELIVRACMYVFTYHKMECGSIKSDVCSAFRI